MTVEELLSQEIKVGDFARNLRLLRVWRGLDQGQLSKKSGVDRSSISRLESGHNSPQAATLEKLAAALEVSEETLRG